MGSGQASEDGSCWEGFVRMQLVGWVRGEGARTSRTEDVVNMPWREQDLTESWALQKHSRLEMNEISMETFGGHEASIFERGGHHDIEILRGRLTIPDRRNSNSSPPRTPNPS